MDGHAAKLNRPWNNSPSHNPPTSQPGNNSCFQAQPSPAQPSPHTQPTHQEVVVDEAVGGAPPPVKQHVERGVQHALQVPHAPGCRAAGCEGGWAARVGSASNQTDVQRDCCTANRDAVSCACKLCMQARCSIMRTARFLLSMLSSAAAAEQRSSSRSAPSLVA